MDNRRIDICSEGHSSLEAALGLFWPQAAGGKATHYKIVKLAWKQRAFVSPSAIKAEWNEMSKQPDFDTLRSSRVFEDADVRVESCHKPDPKGIQTLVLYWSEEKDTLALPFPLKSAAAAYQFVQAWLDDVDYEDDCYSNDGDVSRGKGWRTFNESWGHVLNSPYAIVAVQPYWAWYGK